MIQGHGNEAAAVMFVADGGSGEEEKSNYAITGYSEVVLRELISGLFDLKDCYRTTLVKERIKHTEFESYEKLIPKYSNLLIEEIKYIKPNLIVPLGEGGLRFLTNLNNIRKFRGSVILSHPELPLPIPTKVLPILGPYPYLNQDFKMRWVTQIDLAKIPKYSGTTGPPENNIKPWIATSAAALRLFLERSYDQESTLAFDIETFMGIPTCISFCFDGYESVCVPFLDKSIDLDNRVLMIGMVARLLASPIKKINQNIKYDWKILERFGFRVNNVVGDTMLAASCLTPELPKNLGFLTSIYTDLPYFKDEGKEFDPSIHKRERFYLYNAKDSIAAHIIHRQQVEECNILGCREVYDSLVKLIPIYKKMENNGLLIDQEQHNKLYSKYTTLFNIQILKLHRLTGIYNLNPLSPKQVDKLLFNDLGFKKGRYVKDTGEESLDWLVAFGEASKSPIYGKQIIQAIQNARKIHKVIEYLETISYPDNRWRSDYNLAGTETGRSSAGKSTDVLIIRGQKKSIELYKLGRSFQTIGKHGFVIDGETHGKDLRTMFVPTPGYSFVEVDLSQAEARVDAVLAGNYEILEVFDGPVGIHKLTGSWVFDCEPTEIKKNQQVVDERTGIAVDRYLMSKSIRHAGERNMKPDRLVMMTQQPLSFCKQVLEKFHGKQPEIQQVFHKDVIDCVNRERRLVSPNGRIRQFLGRKDHHMYNEAISQLPQSIVSDQTKFSFIPTTQEAPWARLVNEAHDGSLAEVPKGKEIEYYQIYKRNVEIPIDFNNCSLQRNFKLVIPSELSVSDTNWYELKEIKV